MATGQASAKHVRIQVVSDDSGPLLAELSPRFTENEDIILWLTRCR
jgi:hypothetical protein